MGLDNSDYASIIFVYSLIYTIGQFVNGYLSDTFGPRKVVTFGLFLSSYWKLISRDDLFCRGDCIPDRGQWLWAVHRMEWVNKEHDPLVQKNRDGG